MKQIFTLLTALVLTNYTFAQYSQNFDGSISAGCTAQNGSLQTTTVGEVINGTGSLYSTPPVTGSSTRDFSTPYLNISSASLTVSFNYKLNSNLVGQAERTIQIGLEDANGFTPLHTILMDKDNDPEVSTPFNQTFAVTTPSTKRLTLRMGGSNGAGTVRIIIDDLNVSASTYYVGGCNTAPSIQNDTYNAPVLGTFFAPTSVLANDNDINGETVGSITTITSSPDGSVVWNADGTFTFTPNPGFAGTSTTFTYQAFDNGYTPASGTATVTINFPEAIVLPLKLISFQGALSNSQSQLQWTVAENESGKYFEVEKSFDGRSYTTAGVVLVTQKSGSETYSYKEGIQNATFYRLKMVNGDGSVSYSKIILIKAQEDASATIALLQNPVRDNLSFSFTSLTDKVSDVTIYSLSGAKVLTQRIATQKGRNSISIALNNYITSGTYILEVRNNTERSITKFIK